MEGAMAKVDAFIEAGNEHRSVAIGGRRRNRTVRAWLNTATGTGEHAMSVSAYVWGQKDRKNDERKASFSVVLPKADPSVRVSIELEGGGLRALAEFGAALVGLKTAEDYAAGRIGIDKVRANLSLIGEVVEGLEKERADIPDVTLPGGVTLAHALACVAVVEKLREGGGGGN